MGSPRTCRLFITQRMEETCKARTDGCWPGGVAVVMAREAAGSPGLMGSGGIEQLWIRSAAEKAPLPGLSEPILTGTMHTDGGHSVANKRRGSTTREAL
ncbi:hypothetical protein MHYP_G00229400 [Metynnis hypsauchen]